MWFATKKAPHLVRGYGGVGDNGSYHVGGGVDVYGKD